MDSNTTAAQNTLRCPVVGQEVYVHDNGDNQLNTTQQNVPTNHTDLMKQHGGDLTKCPAMQFKPNGTNGNYDQSDLATLHMQSGGACPFLPKTGISVNSSCSQSVFSLLRR